MQRLGGVTPETFERVVHSQLGDSDFMLFHEIDHSQWLPVFGIRRRALRLILGNPLIAITMMRHDIAAGLFAPIELLLYDSDRHWGTTVIYDLPSSMLALGDDPAELVAAARELDLKLQALVEDATSAVSGDVPEKRRVTESSGQR